MKLRLSNVPGRGLAALGLAGLLLTTSGSNLTATSADSRNALVGVWSIQVTLRDCATDAPLGAPINSLVSFHEGGTLSETPGGLAFRPRSAQRRAWPLVAEGPAHLPSEIHRAPELRHAGEPPRHAHI